MLGARPSRRGAADRRPGKLWGPSLSSSPLGYNKSEGGCQGALGDVETRGGCTAAAAGTEAPPSTERRRR